MNASFHFSWQSTLYLHLNNTHTNFSLSFSYRFKITKLKLITCIINKDLLLKLLHTLEAIHSRIFTHLHLPMKKKNKTAEIFFKNLQKHCSTRQNVNALLSSFLLSLIHLHEIIAGWGKFSTPTCQFPMAPS